MGKISDAIERHEKEVEIATMSLSPDISRVRSIIPSAVDPKLISLTAPESLEAEYFKVLRSQILFSKNIEKPRTIMVTSAFPAEGKTFVSCNLAVTIAQGLNEHALLIDCDFRNPNLQNMLGYENKEGLQEYLNGKRDLADLFIRTNVEKLSLLTAGKRVPNPSELLSSSKMKLFFEEVKSRYQDRYIIIDTAPSEIVSEVGVLSNYVDCIVFVIRARRAPREIIKKCINKVGKDKIIGIVLNGYDSGEKSYGAYYNNYYTKNR